ncbi:MAG: hypothetical protein ABSD31_21410 [Candidatus Binataceae bacterium]
MAFQGYRSRSDQTVGANEATKKRAPGHEQARNDPPPGGENKTPAPVSAAQVLSARDSAWGRAHDGAENPGANSYGQASSLNPGQKADPAAVNPCAPVDAVKDAILAGGAKAAQRSDDWQTRSSDYTSEQADPTAWGNRSRAMDDGSPGSVIPKKNG